MVSAIATFHRNGLVKASTSSSEDCSSDIEDSARLLSIDQKESSLRENKTSKKGRGVFGGLFLKRNKDKRQGDEEYIPPTAPTSPTDGPLNVTVLTSEIDALGPYGVSRANTNISDLTGTPHRRVGFVPVTTKVVETAVGNSTPPRDVRNGSIKEESHDSTPSTCNSDDSSDDEAGHEAALADNLTTAGGTQYTAETGGLADAQCPDKITQNDVISRTLGLFDDICKVPRRGGQSDSNEAPQFPTILSHRQDEEAVPATGDEAAGRSGHTKGSPPPPNTLKGDNGEGQAEWGTSPSDDDDDDNDSFLQSMESTVEESTQSVDPTGSGNTNSIVASNLTTQASDQNQSSTNPSMIPTLDATEEGVEIEEEEQQCEDTRISNNSSPAHENFEVVLDLSLLEQKKDQGPKRRSWFSGKRDTGSEVVSAVNSTAVARTSSFKNDTPEYLAELSSPAGSGKNVPVTPQRNKEPMVSSLAQPTSSKMGGLSKRLSTVLRRPQVIKSSIDQNGAKHPQTSTRPPEKGLEVRQLVSDEEKRAELGHEELSPEGTGLLPIDDERDTPDHRPSTPLLNTQAHLRRPSNSIDDPKVTDPNTSEKPAVTSEIVQLDSTDHGVPTDSARALVEAKEEAKSQVKAKNEQVQVLATADKAEASAHAKIDTSRVDVKSTEKTVSKAKKGHIRTSSLGGICAKLMRKKSKDESDAKTIDGKSNQIALNKGSTEQSKKEKPLWKAVIDPNTGRTYYYHRKTRETTWTKPPDVARAEKESAKASKFPRTKAPTIAVAESLVSTINASIAVPVHASGVLRALDVVPEKSPSAVPELPVMAPVQEVTISPSNAPAEVQVALAPQVAATMAEPAEEAKLYENYGQEVQDTMIDKSEFNDGWETKKEINRLLTCLQPPDKGSVDELMKEYAGNEDQLLRRLRDLVETKPFDEPFLDEPPVVEEDVPKSILNPSTWRHGVAFNTRSRTATTAASRNSATTRSSNKTDRTEKVRNTYRGRDVIDPIKENKVSLDSSISEFCEDTSLSTGLGPGLQSPVPEKVPTIARRRELKVEEFTGSRVVPETYDASGRIVRGRLSTGAGEKKAEHPLLEQEDQYHGDNDTYGTDSVSALSENDVDFANRKENFEHARRRALDDAIEREDWELAAALSEGMRPSSGDYTMEQSTWTQSEMDKFISQNDWGAVSGIIAQLREGKKPSGPRPGQTPKSFEADGLVSSDTSQSVLRAPSQGRKNHNKDKSLLKDSSLQKRIGSRSQLQHGEILSESSWTSESSYDSEYDSEYS
jgi:hypothetical protein